MHLRISDPYDAGVGVQRDVDEVRYSEGGGRGERKGRQ